MRSIASLKTSAPDPDFGVAERYGVYDLVASSVAAPKGVSIELSGVGCTSTDCNVSFRLRLPVTVRTLAAPPGDPDGFTSPSPDRLAAGAPIDIGGVRLGDQLDITLGTPDAVGTRAAADAIASQVGGVISGGLEVLGVYEIRWTAPQDLEAKIRDLEALDGVTSVSPALHGIVGTEATPPGDWDDDTDEVIWPFTQIRAQQAWDTSTGSDVTVGIVDSGRAYADHEDLDTVEKLGSAAEELHATHVAGLACASANGLGLVGAAWGCSIVSTGLRDSSPTAVLEAATRAAQSGARVVNMSLGYYLGKFCHTAAQMTKVRTTYYTDKDKKKFRQLFQGPTGSGIVWTIAAGNQCGPGVLSPWAANADLPNVITVAATNESHELASFSNFGAGVEVAAPGGVGAAKLGLWSTGFRDCGLFNVFKCSTYYRDYGTSMAAPVVAGVAALVSSAHSGYTADTIAACITQTAGENVGWAEAQSGDPATYVPQITFLQNVHRLPIVNAERAVQCTDFDSSDAGSYVGSWNGAGWILDLSEESPGVLGAVNQRPTGYPSGCSAPAGLKLISGLTLSGSGQWNGKIAGSSNCQSFSFADVLAMRTVRIASGEVVMRLAWARDSNGTRPTIDSNGSTVSATPYWVADFARPSSRSGRAARLVVPGGDDQLGAASPSTLPAPGAG